jgi:hypothetical protein
MDRYDIYLAEKTLRNAGYEPEKPVSCLTVKQLYLLIRFVVNRVINHETI